MWQGQTYIPQRLSFILPLNKQTNKEKNREKYPSKHIKDDMTSLTCLENAGDTLKYITRILNLKKHNVTQKHDRFNRSSVN